MTLHVPHSLAYSNSQITTLTRCSEFDECEDIESSIYGTEYSFELTLQKTTIGNVKCEKCRKKEPLESFVGRQTEKTNKHAIVGDVVREGIAGKEEGDEQTAKIMQLFGT